MANEFGTILNTDVQTFDAPVLQKGPNPVSILFDNMASNLQTFVQTDRQARADKRAKAAADRQAKEDAYKDLGRNAEADAMFAAYQISQGQYPGMGPQTVVTDAGGDYNRPGISVPVGDALTDSQYAAIEGDVNKAGKVLTNYRNAVQQGTLPGISADAALDKSIQDLINKHGTIALPFIVEGFKKIGVEGGILNDLKADIDSRQADSEAIDKDRTEAYAAGANTLTQDEINTLSYDQVVNIGRQIRSTETKMEQAAKQAQLQGQLITNSKAQRDLEKEAASQEVFNTTIDVITAKLAPRINAIMDIAREIPPGSNPQLDKRLLDSVALMKEQMNVVVEESLLRAARAGGFEVTEDLRKSFTNYLENTFIKPIEERGSRYAPALKAMQDALQLDVMKVAPFISALQQAGVKIDAVPAFADMINRDPALRDRLAKEVMGLSKYEIGSNTAKMELNDIISLMNGNEALENYTPAQQSKYLKKTWQMTNTIGKDIRNGDLGNSDLFMNGLSVFINATNGMSPVGPDAILISNNAANAIAGGWGRDGSNTQAAINQLLKDDSTRVEAISLAQATRASGATVLNNMRRQAPTYKEGYYSVTIDRNGHFQTVFDQKAWERDKVQSFGSAATSAVTGVPVLNPTRATRPDAPDLMKKFVANANNLVKFMATTGGWEEGAPKGSYNELTALYGAGRMTPQMRKEAEAQQSQKRGGQSAERRLNKALDTLDQEVRQGGFDLSVDVTPGGNGSRGERNKNPGNLEASAWTQKQEGYVGSDGRFAIFDTMENGIKAQEKLLRGRYFNGPGGTTTIDALINRYGNDPGTGDDQAVANYKSYVAKKLGIGVNDTITKEKVAEVARYMREFETGNRS